MRQSEFTVEPDIRELRTITRTYSDEEKQEMANKASDLNNTINLLVAEKKEKMAEYAARIKAHKAEQDMLTARRQRGADFEQVMCEGHLEDIGGIQCIVFYDEDGVRVDHRQATPSERQTQMKLAANG